MKKRGSYIQMRELKRLALAQGLKIMKHSFTINYYPAYFLKNAETGEVEIRNMTANSCHAFLVFGKDFEHCLDRNGFFLFKKEEQFIEGQIR